jgi:hypothetical protein
MKTASFILTAVFSVAVLSVSAQSTETSVTTPGGTTFGIRAGVNFQNINGKDANGDKLENKIKTGFNAGVNAEIPVATDFYIQPGVLFSTKGAKFENSDDKINLSYVEVPVNLVYKPLLGTGRVMIGFGPYAGFAVGGKIKQAAGDDFDIKFEKDITQTENQSWAYAKRFDAGANFLAGYEFSNKLSFQLNAQLGLININSNNASILDDKTARKNTGFGISAGYRF